MQYNRYALTRLRIIEIKNYAKCNSTIFIIRDYTIIKLIRLKYCCYAVYLLNIEERTIFSNARRIVRGLENSAFTSLLIYSNYALQKYSLLTLIGIVLYNAIKEYYNDRTRKIIYFYSYTVENKCRTSYSNKKDIEANKREDEFAILVEKYIIDNRIIYALALIKDK
ncbi:hypothetical protein HBH65_068860 [Parastagonospora nodorum]|nr:hypothetical protein HBI02_010480 [Parastagonospora nodorum]KAH4582198.1 hypothetical protein HBH83_165400 [Parastagonospora nodorum]KAH4658316.1 hypothetical protein HBH80_144740 [Parastagonospora nodorum]KAH4782232.1 hypothetical protein HBH65_068860 [Parastagonospora nodorum]